MILLSTGCQPQSEPPQYNHLRVQLLHDTFQALQAGDEEAALNALQRFRGVSENPDIIDSLITYAHNRMTLENVGQALATGDIQDARELARSAVARHGRTRELLRIMPLLEALEALQTYLQGRPYRDANSAEAALEAALRAAEPLTDNPQFSEWVQAEQGRIAKRRRQEQLQRIDTLLKQADPLVAAGHSSAEVLLAEVGLIMNDYPLAILRHRLLSTPQTLLDFIKSLNPNEPTHLRSLEIFSLWYWNQLPEAVVKYLQQAIHGLPTKTLCGLELQARLAAKYGNQADALRLARRYLGKINSADRIFLSFIIHEAVLPAGQFKAHVWRVPLPSVNNFLNRLVQMREHQQ